MAATAEIPKYIGKYKIEKLLAQGGMGAVYLAIHPSLQRHVILKKLTLRASNPAIRERFRREAQILLDLTSSYIVRMYDYFREGRSDYIVLELVDGLSLDKVLKKQFSLSPQLALVIFLDACCGLRVAHERGIVHRDIKPGNILISLKSQIKLADFGIASGEKENEVVEVERKTGLLSSANKAAVPEGITKAGSTLGTPAYMSPEQLDDSRSVDQRADIYSMGVMLYEMVTGNKPYKGDMQPETIAKIKAGRYIPPEKLDKSLPRIVRVLIKKMMKPDPAKRYQSIKPVIKKLKSYLSKYDTHAIRVDLVRAIKAEKQLELPKFYVRKRAKAIKRAKIACVIVVSLSLLLAGWFSGFFHSTVLRPWYTPIALRMEMPKTASVAADLPARAFFFVNDNDEIPEVKGSRRIFESEKQDENAKTITVKTRPVFLRPGDYRIKIAEGPYVWWKSVTVGTEKLSLDLDFLKDVKRTLTIRASAFDADTGKDITSKCNFLVETAKGKVNLKRIKPSELRTGSVYRIHIVADGYKEEYFGLRVDWYQDELFINGSLRKK